tara:strand:- start:218 stop:406 length:189 start_codon:yes stop_codon:yes gene_type:complete
MAMLEANPVVKAELECIDVSIRKERSRLLDIEFDTDEIADDSYLTYLRKERLNGVKFTVLNF